MNYREYTEYIRKKNLINTPESILHLHRAAGLAKEMKLVAAGMETKTASGLAKEEYIALKTEYIAGEIALALAKTKPIERMLEERGSEWVDWMQRVQLKLTDSLNSFSFYYL